VRELLFDWCVVFGYWVCLFVFTYMNGYMIFTRYLVN